MTGCSTRLTQASRRPAAGLLSVLAFLLSVGRATGWAATPLPPESDQWVQVKTAHFVLFSNASENSTIEIGTNLERFRETLARLVSGLRMNSPLPTWIYVFKNDASFQPYKKRVGLGPANVSGEFLSDRDGNYVGIDATPTTDPWTVVYHEYTHYVLNNNFTDIPLWFNEGIAECFSTFTAETGHAEIGRPIDAHVRWLRAGKWISIEDLFAIDEKSKDYNEGEHQGTFYAESWALAHYLMYGRPAGQARGAGFLAQFPQRAGLQDALKPFLGPDWGDLEARLVEYVRRGRFNESLIDLDDLRVDARAETAPMTRAEALCRLGDYLAHGQPERAGDAQAYYQAAIRIDASHAAAYSGLGFLRDLQKRPDDAAGYFEKAISLQPDDPLTLFLYAENLVERFTPSGTIVRRWAGDTPPELVRARELYRKSIRLRPDVAEAYAGLGLTYIFDEGDLTAGIEALEKARLLLPSRMDVVINLVGLYARSGEVSKARDLVDRVLARSGHPQELEAGRELLLESELKTAQTLADKGDVDAALKILKAVMAGTRDAALRKTLAEQIDGVERTREHNRQIQIYNQAVTLANGRDYRKAAALLEDLVKVADDPKLADMTRQLLTQVRQAIAAGRRP